MVKKKLEGNIFFSLAQQLWKRGEDGEDVARELAKALKAVIQEGTATDHVKEYERLTSDSPPKQDTPAASEEHTEQKTVAWWATDEDLNQEFCITQNKDVAKLWRQCGYKVVELVVKRTDASLTGEVLKRHGLKE